MNSLSLNDKLHLVIPVYGDDGETVIAWVHSAPISREVFQAHYKLVARTFSTIYGDGLHILGGPRVALFVLQDIAKQMDDPASALALMNEIRRLTNVLTRGPGGWASMPLQDVTDQKTLNEDDISEVTNAIVFFIVASAMHRKRELREMMDGAARIWGARTSYLDFTAFVASLGTSTSAAPTTTIPAPASSGPF